MLDDMKPRVHQVERASRSSAHFLDNLAGVQDADIDLQPRRRKHGGFEDAQNSLEGLLATGLAVVEYLQFFPDHLTHARNVVVARHVDGDARRNRGSDACQGFHVRVLRTAVPL